RAVTAESEYQRAGSDSPRSRAAKIAEGLSSSGFMGGPPPSRWRLQRHRCWPGAPGARERHGQRADRVGPVEEAELLLALHVGSRLLVRSREWDEAHAERGPIRWVLSAHVSRVAERVPPGLRPHREPVRLLADRNRAHLSRARIDRIHDIVVAAGEPERLAVRADIAHVGAAAAGDRPGRDDLAGREVQHRHAALAMRLAVHGP